MSNEELLKSRYKVMSDYPEPKNHPYYELGKIIIPITEDDFSYFIKYPYLFRKLKWYEEREPTEMPEYVKQVNGNAVYKVHKHFDFEGERGWGFVAKHDMCNRYYNRYLPATEEEYLSNFAQLEGTNK